MQRRAALVGVIVLLASASAGGYMAMTTSVSDGTTMLVYDPVTGSERALTSGSHIIPPYASTTTIDMTNQSTTVEVPVTTANDRHGEVIVNITYSVADGNADAFTERVGGHDVVKSRFVTTTRDETQYVVSRMDGTAYYDPQADRLIEAYLNKELTVDAPVTIEQVTVVTSTPNFDTGNETDGR